MSGLDIRLDGRTTIFTLNRPEKRNAINAEMAETLQQGFAAFDASDQRVAIIAGAGTTFSSGADITDPPALWKIIPTIGVTTTKPVICAVQGWCIGGAMVLVAMADLGIAAESARFHYPEARVGLTGGLIATLAGRVPHKLAMEIMLLGEPVGGRRAYEMGLVNQVVPDGEELGAALAMARKLELLAPLVLQTLKHLVTEEVLVRTPSERMARTQRDLERVNLSADTAEGLAAFRERRAPVFTGR